MALLDDVFGDVFKAVGPPLLVGVGAALLAPILLPAVAAGMRPLAKTAVKGYLALTDKVKEMAAESGEQLSDLVAEARAEREAELAAAVTGAAAAPNSPPAG